MADRFWIGGTGTWDGSSTTNWSTTSGGSSGASVPGFSDAAIFDAGSDAGSGFTVTISGTGGRVGSIDTSGLDQDMTLAGSPGYIEIRGALNLAGGRVTWSSTSALYLGGTSSHSFTSGGTSFSCPIIFQGAGSTYTLQDALTTTGAYILFERGTFNANGYNVTTPGGRGATGVATRNVTMGAGTWTITGSGTNAWLFSTATGLTVTAGTSTLLFTSASAKTANLGAYTFNVLSQGGSGRLDVTHTGATVADVQNAYKATGATAIRFTAGQTLTTTSFTAAGESGRVLTIDSSSAGSAFTLSDASGTVSVDYLSLRDSTATGGAAFYAGANSTDVSGNTGWTFTSVPVIASAAITEASDSVSSAGSLPIVAQAAIATAGDALSSAGVLPIVGVAAITTAGDTLSSAGVLPIVGAGAIGEAGDSLVSAARLALIAAAAISEADDTLSAFGSDPIEADLSVTEADDTLSADSWVRFPIAAALAVTEAGDVAAAASSSRTWQQVAVNSESWTRVSR
jgi:hypothetical protein